jgi:hypothetical protein
MRAVMLINSRPVILVDTVERELAKASLIAPAIGGDYREIAPFGGWKILADVIGFLHRRECSRQTSEP